MAHRKYWQAHVTYTHGDGEPRFFTFGLQANSLPAALLRAYRQAAEIPVPAEHITVTRLYGYHHPHRRALHR